MLQLLTSRKTLLKVCKVLDTDEITQCDKKVQEIWANAHETHDSIGIKLQYNYDMK